MIEFKWSYLLILLQILRINAVYREQINEQISDLLTSKCPVKITTMRYLDGYGFCKIPDVIPNGRLLSVDGLKKGSMAKFICDDYHFTNITHGVCRSDGTWEGLNKPCVLIQVTYYPLKTLGRIRPGRCVVILALARRRTPSWIMNLYAQDMKNILFHAHFRFNTKKIVLNTRIDFKWDREESKLNSYPFEFERETNIKLCFEDDLYRCYADGKELFTFKYRFPVTQVELLCIESIVVRSVAFIEGGK